MKKLFHFLLVFIVLNTLTECKAETGEFSQIISTSDTLKIATYNIRIITSADTGICSWTKRKKYLGKLINTHQPDIFGVQEVLNTTQQNQLHDLTPAYNCFAKGRDNTAGTRGERLAIFYNKTRFSVANKGFFFLSETPSVASKGWDAALNRICLWMKFYDNITHRTFFYFNVHFDHIGTTARAESAKLVVNRIKEMAGDSIAVCGGDFNASPYETAVYNTMTSTLNDSKKQTETPPTGTGGTFNGWDFTSTAFGENKRIDYIYSNNIRVLSYAVLNDKSTGNAYPSDHFPILVSILFNK